MTEDIPFVFDEWVVRAGFTSDSTEKLRKANLFSERSIAGLKEEELLEVKLSLGDRSVFRDEWSVIQAKYFATYKPTAAPDVDSASRDSEILDPSDS